jgi:hypothetical protein
METQTQASQAAMTPAEALARLKEGNARFVETRQIDRDLLQQVGATGSGQYPFAIVLGCVDSRVSPELVFDQGIGDIFTARIAGNFVNADILGSMEFACKVTGAKLIFVLGHSHCGAIMGAVDDAQPDWDAGQAQAGRRGRPRASRWAQLAERSLCPAGGRKERRTDHRGHPEAESGTQRNAGKGRDSDRWRHVRHRDRRGRLLLTSTVRACPEPVEGAG